MSSKKKIKRRNLNLRNLTIGEESPYFSSGKVISIDVSKIFFSSFLFYRCEQITIFGIRTKRSVLIFCLIWNILRASPKQLVFSIATFLKNVILFVFFCSFTHTHSLFLCYVADSVLFGRGCFLFEHCWNDKNSGREIPFIVLNVYYRNHFTYRTTPEFFFSFANELFSSFFPPRKANDFAIFIRSILCMSAHFSTIWFVCITVVTLPDRFFRLGELTKSHRELHPLL